MNHVAHRGPRPGRAPRAVGRLPLLALGLGLALAGCARQGTAIVGTAGLDTHHVSLQQALDAMLRPDSPTAAETFLRSLPPPLAIRDLTVPNPHDPRWKDTVRTLVYDGLELTVYRVSSTGSRFPMAVRVTSPAYTSSSGLRVGLSSAQLVAILGPPSDRSGGRLIYRFVAPGSAPFELMVDVKDGRVQALSWAAYLD